MSISASSLAEAAVADWKKPDARKIAPKRVVTAVRDCLRTHGLIDA